MRKVSDLWQKIALNRNQFTTMMHQIFPEIAKIHYVRFSKEGNQFIQNAINSIFNSFDTDNSGRLTFSKLERGFDILCDTDPNYEIDQYQILNQRRSEPDLEIIYQLDRYETRGDLSRQMKKEVMIDREYLRDHNLRKYNL